MENKILVIDDEESIRFAFNNFLEEEGYKVTTAAGYEEALSLMSKENFDLIFADIFLGKRSGIDILRETREKNIFCPVIIITGSPDVDSASEAVRLGAYDYVSKPLRRGTILRLAQTALQFRELTLEKEKYRSNLEAIFRSVRDAIITVDSDLTLMEINDAAIDICGMARDMIGKTFDPLQKGCSGKCRELLEETIEAEKPLEIFRTECMHKEHPGQVVTLNTYPLVYKQGKVSGVVLVVRDETDISELEKNLKERHQLHNIIGKSEEMQQIYSLIERLAEVQTTVLLTGESGTGKELAAEAIHYRGARREKPFVSVNCSALTESLLESELFGHVKGAFTGAIRDEIGRFKRADGGTIFLDEIGDISPRMQLRLLGVLQKMEFERVGDSTPIKVDVRVIAATNANLREKVRLGEFREDLYYRLKVVELHLPPLRKRREDIPLLVDHFVRKFRMKFNKDIAGVSDDSLRLIMNYSWPGNVRELEHVLEHAFVICNQSIIAVNDLPRDLTLPEAAVPAEADEGKISGPQAIIKALEKAEWNKAKAARILGMSRNTLYRKLKEFGIGEPE